MRFRTALTAFASFTIALLQAQQQPEVLFQRSYGGNHWDYFQDVQVTPDGGYVVAGYTGSTDGELTGLGTGGDLLWVAKLAVDGAVEWQYVDVDDYESSAMAIRPVADGYIVAGGEVFNGLDSALVLKLDLAGNVVWRQRFGGTEASGFMDIRPTNDGGYIAAGSTFANDGDVSGAHGGKDAWVVKLDAGGAIEWQHALGGTLDETGRGIVETTDGYVMMGSTNSNDGDVSGSHGLEFDVWMVKLDLAGGLVWQHPLGGTSEELSAGMVPTGDGGFILSCVAYSNDGDLVGIPNPAGSDLWAVRLDASGDIVWQRLLGGNDADLGYDVALHPDGGFVLGGITVSTDGDVTGHHGGIVDLWVVKTDANGDLLWQRALGGSDEEYNGAIAVTPEGDVVMAGYTYSKYGDVNPQWQGAEAWVVGLATDVNRVQGTLFADINENTIADVGEPGLPNRTVFTAENGRLALSKPDGTYNLWYHEPGTYTVLTRPIELFHPVPSEHAVTFAGLNEVAAGRDFAFQATGEVNDLVVSLTGLVDPRPGFPMHYSIHYTNMGNTSIAPTILFQPDAVMSFDSASVTSTSVVAGLISWTLPALGPFEQGDLLVHLTIDVDAVPGSVTTSVVDIEPLVDDDQPANNHATWRATVVASLDPNDIVVDRATIDLDEIVAPPALDYTIRFQNTGTASAITVRIENTLPPNSDLTSFEFTEASHPVQATYMDHVKRMVFLFENIDLPDSNTSEPNSHGYVRYKLKPRSDLALGDSILNTAAIFFDFNAPVLTNTAYTVVETTTNMPTLHNDEGIALYPNPTSGSVRITTGRTMRQAALTITDALGREVHGTRMSGTMHTLDLGDLPRGLYQVTLRSEQGIASRRLVLE